MRESPLERLRDEPIYRLLKAEVAALKERVPEGEVFGEILRCESVSPVDDRISFYRRVLAQMMQGEFPRVIPADPCTEIDQFGTSLALFNRELDHRFAEARALVELTAEINEGLFVEEVLDHVFDTFSNLVPYTRIGFSLLEDHKVQGRIIRTDWLRSESGNIRIHKNYSQPLIQTTLGGLIESGKPRILNDLEEYLRTRPKSDSTRRLVEEGMRANLTWPLMVKGEAMGFLFFSSNQKNIYDDVHTKLFTQIAGRLAMTLEKAKLYQRLTKRNHFIRKVFGRYLTAEIAEVLLDDPSALRLGGQMRKVTVLMSDIRSFTSMSERLSPEQVVMVLNNHLDVMVKVIQSHGGIIDNFIGDAILALFGAPIPRDDDAARAVACALAMQRGMAEVNERNRAMGLPDLSMGIGLNTGEVVAGNIGSKTHTKYSVIGAPVNHAARIEGLTKGGQVLISDRTLKEAGPQVLTGNRFQAKVKGVDHPVTVHEVEGLTSL